jgi:nickel/cobalt transporter (NicO) family protein
MRRIVIFIRVLMALAAMALAFATPSSSQDAEPQVKIEKRQLLVPRKGDAAEAASFFESPMEWIREKQQSFYASMAKALRDIRGGASFWAAWTLISLSFAYGVLHAAGPGHGKAVISAWLLATESELKRGVLIAFLSSIVQALAAIAIVSAVLFLFSGAILATRTAAGVLESVSYALIGAMGLYLIWSAFRPAAHAHAAHGHGGHNHGHDHHHHHDRDDHANCGHAHVPEAKDVREDWSLAKAISMSFAIGIRPCTGAILVLLAAYPLGLYWAGVASAFAMAAGTFLTVAIIAALTVYSKQIAMRFAGDGKPWLKWANFSVRVAAGLLVAVLGGTLFWASLGSGFLPA